MNKLNIAWIEKITKQQLETTITFAIEKIPDIDAWTLDRFLDYVSVTGEFSSVAKGELLEKMRLMRAYLPNSCRYTLLMLAELLELEPSISEESEHQITLKPKTESLLRRQSRLIFIRPYQVNLS